MRSFYRIKYLASPVPLPFRPRRDNEHLAVFFRKTLPHGFGDEWHEGVEKLKRRHETFVEYVLSRAARVSIIAMQNFF